MHAEPEERGNTLTFKRSYFQCGILLGGENTLPFMLHRRNGSIIALLNGNNAICTVTIHNDLSGGHGCGDQVPQNLNRILVRPIMQYPAEETDTSAMDRLSREEAVDRKLQWKKFIMLYMSRCDSISHLIGASLTRYPIT